MAKSKSPIKKSGKSHRKTKAAKAKPQTSSFLSGFRIVRASINTLILLLIVGFAATWFVQHSVMKRIRGRSLLSSSVIVSRPFPLAVSQQLTAASLEERLTRLRYQKVETKPQQAGHYYRNGTYFHIYLRATQLPSGEVQSSSLVRVNLVNNMINSVFDTKYQKSLRAAFLEPEVISLLDTSERRAINPKSLDAFPQDLVNAVISIEDERFYSHFGVDLIAIARAMFVNVRSGSIRQGGSTITQQLAKNLFFSAERSLTRKALEAITAVLIESAFTKEQILEFYLNEVFLGQEGLVAIHGFGEAAFSFFGKEVADLNLAEAATLAGIIKAPSAYSPRRHPKRAKKRRGMVLAKMHELGHITESQAGSEAANQIKVQPMRHSKRLAPYFTDFARKELRDYLTYWPSDLEKVMVHTGLDVDYQQCADQAVLKGLHRITQHHPRLKTTKPQAALLSISLIDNGIRAWVGGRDYSASQFCRISQAMRQPGSAFKPIVYLTALDASLNNYRTARTTSLLADEPLTLEVRGTGLWSPQNYSKKYYGEVTVRQALLKSLNIPTVNLALKVGIPSVKRTAQALGLESPMLAVPSLALGAAETRLLDLTQAYQTFASGCHFHRLRAVSAITSPDDAEPLYMSPNDSRKVCSEDAAYVLTNMLQSVIEHGTGRVVRRLGFERPAAGKTGTSNDARDSWFAGYTPSLLTVVWVGFDDSRNLGLTGSQAAAPIWTDYMKCTEEFEPALNFLPPDGVVFKHIDAPSGLLWTPSCSESDKITEVFVKGTEPITPCHRPPGYESQDRRQQGRTPSPTPRSRKMSLFNRIFGS